MRKAAFARSPHDEARLGDAARWILMLPLAAFCAAIAYGAGAIGTSTLVYALLGAAASSDLAAGAAASTVASATMAYVFVWSAVIIAPSRRDGVAQALIGVGSAVAAVVMYDAALASGPAAQLAAHGSLASGAGFIAGLLAAGFRLRRLRH